MNSLAYGRTDLGTKDDFMDEMDHVDNVICSMANDIRNFNIQKYETEIE